MYLNIASVIAMAGDKGLTLTWDVFKYASIRQTYLDKAD